MIAYCTSVENNLYSQYLWCQHHTSKICRIFYRTIRERVNKYLKDNNLVLTLILLLLLTFSIIMHVLWFKHWWRNRMYSIPFNIVWFNFAVMLNNDSIFSTFSYNLYYIFLLGQICTCSNRERHNFHRVANITWKIHCTCVQ